MSSQSPKCYETSYGPYPREVFQDYFSGYSVGQPDSNYSYGTNGVSVSDDGIATYDPVNRLLDVNSGVGGLGFQKVWTPTVPNVELVGNRYHYSVLSDKIYTIPTNGDDFVYEMCFSGIQQIGTIPLVFSEGITDPLSDLRIASCGMFIAPNDNGFPTAMFSIYLTNKMIYAGYEIIGSFSHFIPLETRSGNGGIGGLDEYRTYAVAINKKMGYVRWFIDGIEKYKIYNLGIPLERSTKLFDKGNDKVIISPNRVQIGFSTFAPLDMINPVKGTGLLQMSSSAAASPGTPYTAISTTRPLVMFGFASNYIDPTRSNITTGADIDVGQSPNGGSDVFDFFVPSDATTATRLFGNGAQMKIKFLHIHTVKP